MASGSSRGLKRELESGEPEEAQGTSRAYRACCWYRIKKSEQSCILPDAAGDQDESESIVAFALYKPRRHAARRRHCCSVHRNEAHGIW